MHKFKNAISLAKQMSKDIIASPQTSPDQIVKIIKAYKFVSGEFSPDQLEHIFGALLDTHFDFLKDWAGSQHKNVFINSIVEKFYLLGDRDLREFVHRHKLVLEDLSVSHEEELCANKNLQKLLLQFRETGSPLFGILVGELPVIEKIANSMA